MAIYNDSVISRTKVSVDQAMVPSAQFELGFDKSVYTGPSNYTLNHFYSIILIDTRKPVNDHIISAKDLDPHPNNKKKKAEYFFEVAPQVIEVTEPYTTRITPTQSGGMYVESHGSLIREVRVSGNSGIRANRASSASVSLFKDLPGPLAGGANYLAGPVVNSVASAGKKIGNAIDAITGTKRTRGGINKDERTGYDDMMFLRNIFRHYSDLKRTAAGANIVMLWRNVKDADYWVVEPKEFKLVADSKSPLTYTYNIALQTLARWTGALKLKADPLAHMGDFANIVSSTQLALRSVSDVLFAVAESEQRLTSLGISVLNLTRAGIAVINGAAAAVGAFTSVNTQYVTAWRNLASEYEQAKENLNNAAQSGSPPALLAAFGSAVNDTLVVGASGVIAVAAPLTAEQLATQAANAAIGNAFNKAIRTATYMLYLLGVSGGTNNDVTAIRKEQATNAYSRLQRGGDAQVLAPSTAGDVSFLGNDSLQPTLARGVVGHRESLQSIAQRLMGDRARWKLLALVNDLRAPYITTTKEPHTLKPGDYIFYPVVDGASVSTNTLNPSGNDREQDDVNVQTVIEDSYGRDIRLKSSFDNRTDIQVAPGGDIATIVGIANVKQGIRLKFMTEAGTLTVHPDYGSAFPVGSKMTEISLNSFRLACLSTLLSDPRVKQVTRLELVAREDILSVGAELLLQDTADAVTTAFNVRSL